MEANQLPGVPHECGVVREELYVSSRYNLFVDLDGGTKLAYNALSNSLAYMNPQAWDRYRALVSGCPASPGNPVDRELIRGKFVVPCGLDEIALVAFLHYRARYGGRAWSLTIAPTLNCNFACDYCYESTRPVMMATEVQDALVEAVRTRVKRLVRLGVTWYGGEPTLAWNVVRGLSSQFMDICQRADVVYGASLISNGYLLDEKKVAELPELGIRMVQITLDGDKSYHDSRRVLRSGKGTFERIVGNLRNFIGRPANVAIRVNVDDRNRDGVFELIDRLAREGLCGHPNIRIYFAAVHPSGRAERIAGFCLTRNAFSELEVAYYDHAVRAGLALMPYPRAGIGGCGAVRPDSYVVLPDGTLHKCWDTVSLPQYSVGRLVDPVRGAGESLEYLKWMSFDPFCKELPCRECLWLPTCMGGCPLRVVHPEVVPDGLHCSTWKYNAQIMLSRFAGWTAARKTEVGPG